ncbi:hypothetical protein KM043_002419 [Ampulex compressa]|nr:hypothetical protein KM043_002419 [Ampulex compressa]
MLIALIRGAFLLGILTWYSTSVWKMIDGYFKDQFRSYLEEEYRKNPRMRSDVQGTTAGKADPGAKMAAAPESSDYCRPDVCPIEAAENQSHLEEELEVAGGSREGQDTGAAGAIDKNAFLETASESGPEGRRSPENETREEAREEGGGKEDPGRETTRRRAASPGGRPAKDKRPTKRRKVKTITLTERDFAMARKSQASDDDFWEFDEEGEEGERPEGVLVSELPFKPKADIGNLERVTQEEFCPLTLEEEASCGETYKWP